MYQGNSRSRRHPVAFANEQQPIMQPKRPFLPEFYALRHDPKAGPMRRARHRAFGKAARKLLHPPLELGAAGERLRLVRGPGADLTVARPAGEIGVGLLVADQLDRRPRRGPGGSATST